MHQKLKMLSWLFTRVMHVNIQCYLDTPRLQEVDGSDQSHGFQPWEQINSLSAILTYKTCTHLSAIGPTSKTQLNVIKKTKKGNERTMLKTYNAKILFLEVTTTLQNVW